MIGKKQKPTKDNAPKLVVRTNFDLRGQEAGLVRSTDVFSDGAAFGGGEKAAPIVDWDAMAAHARTAANKKLTLAEIFSRDNKYHLISRPVLIALLAGLLGGVFICIFGYFTERVPYQHYSNKGYELLQQKNARPAVEYFLAQSNSTAASTFAGSPYHIASLEALAQSYANDKCFGSADETFQKVIRLLSTAPMRDDVRLASALEHYSEYLASVDRQSDSEAAMKVAKNLNAHNLGWSWIWFFAVLAFAFEGIYMSGVLLGGKNRLENWAVYGAFTVLGMLGITIGMFKLGSPIAGALGLSMAIVYLLLPGLLVLACAVGKNMPAFHVLMPSRKRK